MAKTHNMDNLIEHLKKIGAYQNPTEKLNIEVTNNLIKCCNVGNKTSDFYQQENRWKCNSITAPSAYRSWSEEKFRLTLLNALWSLKFEEITSKALRTAISMRKYIASQFRPSAAKAVYDLFEAKNILDFSAGWGDRLCGFLASDAVSYTGVDPNKDAVAKYCDMLDYFYTDRDVTIFNECAEDVDYGDKMFDLVFTSPPYFDLERYTTESNQSWKRYKKLDAWLEGFLFKSIEKAWNHLEKNGHLIINISDVYCHHTINKICDPMNNFIDTDEDAELSSAKAQQINMSLQDFQHSIQEYQGKVQDELNTLYINSIKAKLALLDEINNKK